LELPEERTLYIVNQAHEPFYRPILDDKRPANLVVQPRNAGTAPAILYGLLRIAAADPQAGVALFPSDHYISDNRKFMNHIRTALDTARVRRGVVILLGVEPESPEVEYGWIEPTLPAKGNAKVSGVRPFLGKAQPSLSPSPATTRLPVEQFRYGRLGASAARYH
jgi:mannose-1-phosphate guanylyltransferase